MEIDATRTRILEAAGSIFAAKGFENATVREICQLAGANLAAVNYYFGDKRRLYIEAVKLAHVSRSQLAPMPAWTEATLAREKLADFIATMLRRLLTEVGATWPALLMLREIARPTDACTELVREYIQPHFALLNQIVREFLPENVPDADVHLTAFSVVGQCLFYHAAAPVVRHLLTPDEHASLDPERLARHITQFSLLAIEQLAERYQSAGVPLAGDTRGSERRA